MHLNNFKDIQFEEYEIQMKNKLKFTVAFIKSTKCVNTSIIRTYYKNYSKSNGSSQKWGKGWKLLIYVNNIKYV